ncbi:hypothetical protein M0R45_009519 [Rubus argutus]|uniref:Uncharacterized protein n=1 Tax=Rubus argutus TaxID=59490 RepID=A0AAW1Y632_RUBAR
MNLGIRRVILEVEVAATTAVAVLRLLLVKLISWSSPNLVEVPLRLFIQALEININLNPSLLSLIFDCSNSIRLEGIRETQEDWRRASKTGGC